MKSPPPTPQAGASAKGRYAKLKQSACSDPRFQNLPAPHEFPTLPTPTGQSNLAPVKSVDNLFEDRRSGSCVPPPPQTAPSFQELERRGVHGGWPVHCPLCIRPDQLRRMEFGRDGEMPHTSKSMHAPPEKSTSRHRLFASRSAW